jgi:hypothetical protein
MARALLANRYKILLALPLLAVLIQILLRILHHPQFVSVDSAVYLNFSQLLLKGKMPYVDFVDVLPPLVFYLFVPPIWLADLTHIGLPLAVLLLTLSLIVYSIVSSIVVLWKRLGTSDSCLLVPVLFGFLLLNLVVFFHYAQKEHIFVLAFMPFFFMRWLRLKGCHFNNWLSILVGLLCGAAVCLKPPMFLFIVVALECYWFRQGKKRLGILAPEIISGAAVLLGFAGWFMLLAPKEMRDAFLGRCLPLTIAGQGSFFRSLNDVLAFPLDRGFMIFSFWPVLLICFMALFLRKSGSLVIPLLVFTLAGYFMYVIQQKGWPYQTIIVVTGYFLLANLELAILARWISTRKIVLLQVVKNTTGPAVLTFMIYSASLSLTLPILIYDSFASGFDPGVVEAIIHKYSRPGDAVLILSRYPRQTYLLQTGTKPAWRYSSCYPIEMLEYIKYHAASAPDRLKYEKEEQTVISEMNEDVRRTHPRLIIMLTNNACWSYPRKPFLYCGLTGFSSVLDNYEPIGMWNGCPVWRRNSTPST